MTPLPNKDELAQIRKKLKARKLPSIHGGMSGQLANVGKCMITKSNQDFSITWQRTEENEKTYLFSELCKFVDLEFERLDFGYLIADIINEEGNKYLHSIPGPNEAMRYAAPYFKLSDNWRHWAQVSVDRIKFDQK